MDCAIIYRIYFPYSKSELIVPSVNDLKIILLDNNEQMLDLLLQGKLQISQQTVNKNSKKYKTAVQNRMVDPIK